MNKANYIESSSSKKTKRPVDVNKRKRIDEGEASDESSSKSKKNKCSEVPEASSKSKKKKCPEVPDETTLEKILRQNNKIISKLETIISNQKSLEARVTKIEEACNNGINNDTKFIKNVIKDIASKLLETSIYLNSDDFQEATRTFINENHKEFMNKFKRPDNWVIYYEKNISSHLDKGKKSVSQTQIAFAISTCELILNPENLDIHVNETVIKPFLIKNLKKIRENEDFYLYKESDERDEENEKERDERDEEEKERDKREEEKEEGNVGEEEEDYEGTFSYQSSLDEQSKEILLNRYQLMSIPNKYGPSSLQNNVCY
ncbi:hypothetical protein GLOIN_2v1591384 [Rhizophagus clarus]|uniref:Uncharacterized protein n=1 Tax=Rhizophagus clarus TaxID=94130 RepID=A0A8H3M268_9GLOM|nr:hypothetical protein GLOIN_2v1591384 [Rhizophagus clarus]